jgi:DNA repair exonuclease SbcCD nuclease subunit
MKILLFTDVHLRSQSDRPKWRTDDHYKQQFAELREISSIAKANKVDLMISLGDFYDHTRVSHQLITDTLTWCKSLPCSLYSVVGNHDVNAYVTSDRNNGLGVLFEAGAVERLDELVFDDKKVVIRGVHVYLDPKQGDYFFTDRKYDNYYKIVASHNFIIPHEVPFDAVLPSQVTTNANVIALGHYHKEFLHREGRTQFINPGSISRWSINEQHQPRVIILDTELDKLTEVRLKCAPSADEIFDLASAAEIKSTEMNLQAFVDSLNNTSFDNHDIEQVVLAESKKQGIEQTIIDLVLEKIRKAKETLV